MFAELDRRARAIAMMLVLGAAVAACGVAIDGMRPLLQAAVDRDPNTAVPAA